FHQLVPALFLGVDEDRVAGAGVGAHGGFGMRTGKRRVGSAELKDCNVLYCIKAIWEGENERASVGTPHGRGTFGRLSAHIQVSVRNWLHWRATDRCRSRLR